MVRVVKEREERKKEIIAAARSLFNEKGYEETSVNDIIKKAGIAKGTFYYYFSSKEEIMNDVVMKDMARHVAEVMPVVDSQTLSPAEKFRDFILQHQISHTENIEVLEFFRKKSDIVMRHKTLVASLHTFSPLIEKIIHEGNQKKIFNVEYPEETAELIMAGLIFNFDPNIMKKTKEEYIKNVYALAQMMEKVLSAEKGSFSFFADMAESMYQFDYQFEEVE